MNYTQTKAYLNELLADRYGKHELAPADTKSWLVSSEGKKGGAYWYTVTWSHPGVLTIGGDIGEITLTHYHAMNSWVNAVSWVAECDYDYLLGKSNLRQEYDSEATFAAVKEELCGRDAKESLVDLRDRLREWREDMRAFNDAAREVERWEDPDEHGPFWTEKPTLRVEFRHEYDWQSCGRPIDQDEANRHWYAGQTSHKVEVPDGWEMWFRLLKLVGEPWHKPNDIFRASVRRELLEALEGRLSGDGNDAADILYRLGEGDYHGSYSWSHQALNLMAALYRWAALVLDGEEYRAAKAKADALAEHRKIVAALDRRMPDDRYDGYSRAPGVLPFNRTVGPEVRNAA